MRSHSAGSYQSRDHRHNLIIDGQDQRRLNAFARHELALFNTIIEAFEARTRSFPAQVHAITDPQIQLLCVLSSHHLTVRSVLQEEANLPEKFSYLQPVLKDSKNQQLAAHLQHVFDSILKNKFAVLPQTKTQMITALCEFFRDQAKIFKEPLHSDSMEVAYKVPPSNMSKMDKSSKRHVQIPKSVVTIKYDADTDRSEIHTPLTVKPMIVENYNLHDFHSWTTLIVRQEPGAYVMHDTPWIAEFRNTHNKYLVRLNDLGSRQHSRSTMVSSKIFG